MDAMGITENEILNNISNLKNYGGKRRSKYMRNYRRYSNTPYASIDDVKTPSEIGWILGADGEDDTVLTPRLNIIKSCIDTLTSKIAQSKVRPFFNCLNGSFKDIQIVKQAQQYFDVYFDAQNVNKVVSEAFRDSCIFDTGAIYVDEYSKHVRKALPWQVHFRPSEMNYGKLTRVYYEQKQFPVSLLPFVIDQLRGYDYVTYGVYYDTYNRAKAIYIPEISLLLKKPYESDRVPFVFLHFNSPVLGDSSESVVDMLNALQITVDELMTRIKDAAMLNPAMKIFVPEGSTIKANMLSNRTGEIMTYKLSPNMTHTPVTTATPDFISNQYMETVNEIKQFAYEMVGISELSATSRKPTGLDSGIALQTAENIESDRFETQLNQVVRAYVDIAKTCIACFDKDEDILPENSRRMSVRWGDIVAEAKSMSIQFSGADALSKDPSTKLQQLQMLAQAGVLPASRIAQFMEIPDLQSGYSLTNNAINAVMTVIDDCVNKGVTDVPEYVPFQMLKEEIINTQLSLKAANSEKNGGDIDRLTELYERVEEKERKWQEDMQAVQEATAQLAAGNESGLPAQQNVLTQEAGMTQAQGVPAEMNGTGADLDVSANGTMAGDWNNAEMQ